jgi:hypothetical protein
MTYLHGISIYRFLFVLVSTKNTFKYRTELVTCKFFFLHGTRLVKRKETEPRRITGKGAGE